MAGGKFTKRDKMAEGYRPPTTIELLSKLAEEHPYGIGGREEPGVTEPLVDPIPTPQGKIAKLAISLPFAKQQISKYLMKGLSPTKLQEVQEALKLLEAVPKRALQTVSELYVGATPALFKTAPNILGHWNAAERRIGTYPWEKLPSGVEYTLPGALSHEFGHEITERLLQRRGKTLEKLYPTEQRNMWEGIAEYLGKSISEKAKVPYTPKFSYGPEQELIFNVLERAPSKNPFMNVFRFLEKEGTLKRR